MASTPCPIASGPAAELSSVAGRSAFSAPRFLAAFGLIAIATLPFVPSLSNDRLLDDNHYVFENPVLPEGLAAIPDIWSGRHLMDYYPATHTALWAEWHLFGPSPRAFRLANLAWHAMGALAVWWAAVNWRFPGAFLLAALWAVHPTNVDAVCWISQHKSTISAIAFATALGAYARFLATASAAWYAAAIVAHLLGMLAKTDVAMLPVLLVLLERWWWPRVARPACAPPPFAGIARHTAAFFLISAAIGCVAVWFMQTRVVTRSLDLGSPVERATKAVWAYGEYWKLVLWPVDLAAVYGEPNLPAAALPAAIVIAGAIGFAWRWRGCGGGLALLGLASMAVLLLPVLYIAEQGFYRLSPVGDRYLHLPLMVPAAMAAAGLMSIAGLPGWRRVGHAAALALLGLLTCLTALHARDYQSAATLWRAALRNQPGAWYAHFGIGSHLVWSEQKFAEALPELQQAIAGNPQHPPSHYVAGFAYLGLHRLDDAIASFQETLRLEREYPNASLALGDTLLERARGGDLDAARAALSAAAAMPESSRLAACELARIDIAAGNLPSAREWLASCGPDEASVPASFERRLASAILDLASGSPARFGERLRHAAESMKSADDRRRLMAWSGGIVEISPGGASSANLRFDPARAIEALERIADAQSNPRRIRRDIAMVTALMEGGLLPPGL